ncbi:YegP family protein [Amantichitinum ursilacus]|uniref:DUF1508 domain-containing protein n=1 Tax=Amantichitinum ursilacus TaxID=857265 RepID=A0A0N0XGJ0_9NEIS|nr:YegP family protein [Amantichitinum ursilacus]KPC50148.1 hypothetical protein WG78_18125 [Amantichitinum ursilacus]
MLTRFMLKRCPEGYFVFRLESRKGKTLLTGEPCASRAEALAAIAAVRGSALRMTRYLRRTDDFGLPYFVLVDANGCVLGAGESYGSWRAVELAITTVSRDAGKAVIEEVEC